jgi:hypothetical protein
MWYANEEFPDTGGLLVEGVIRACWNEKFKASAGVGIALREKLVDRGQELLNEAHLNHYSKTLPKLNEEYAGLKLNLHNFSSLLCSR